jgi:tetraacyldisaccharide-1-P 4'-kinase
MGYADNHWYRTSEIGEIASAARGLPVLTTEKDLVRLPEGLPFGVKALRVGVEFLAGWNVLSRFLLERVRSGEVR